jgi:uncharacterized DUF497 family protein
MVLSLGIWGSPIWGAQAASLLVSAASRNELDGCRLGGRFRKINSVEFEFDPDKSESNKAKHGIDFIQAQALLTAKRVLLHAKEALEKRYLVIGKIEGQQWSAIITYRGATSRIISVRKSTAAEIETYAKIAG